MNTSDTTAAPAGSVKLTDVTSSPFSRAWHTALDKAVNRQAALAGRPSLAMPGRPYGQQVGQSQLGSPALTFPPMVPRLRT